MINSRAKGSAAEREFAGLVYDWSGVRLIRNLEQTRSGGHDLIVHPDEAGPVADAFRSLAIECKRYQSVTEANIQKWWNQAIAQAKPVELMPILAYRANRASWHVVVPLRAVNQALSRSQQLNYCVTLSPEGFCHVMTEAVLNHGVKSHDR